MGAALLHRQRRAWRPRHEHQRQQRLDALVVKDEQRRALSQQAVSHADRSPAGSSGALTLNDLIASTWADLTAGESVACPVCGGGMSAPEAGEGGCPGTTVATGSCVDCGTSLS